MKRSIIACILVAYCVGCVTYGVISWKFLGVTNAAAFGDMFGALNAFFAGLAFLGVIWAITLQKDQLALQARELELQRKELELQRNEIVQNRQELARAAQAQEQSQAALHAQLSQMKLTARLNLLHDIYPILEQMKHACLRQQPQDVPGHKKYAEKENRCRQEMERLFDEMMEAER